MEQQLAANVMEIDPDLPLDVQAQQAAASLQEAHQQLAAWQQIIQQRAGVLTHIQRQLDRQTQRLLDQAETERQRVAAEQATHDEGQGDGASGNGDELGFLPCGDHIISLPDGQVLSISGQRSAEEAAAVGGG